MKIDSYLSTNIVHSVGILMILPDFLEKTTFAFMYFDFSFFHMILWQFLFWQDVFCEFFMWENEKFGKITNYFSWFWTILVY